MPFTDIRASEGANKITVSSCYHCGQACDDAQFGVEDKQFCCYGCKTVYEILQDNNLCEYYSYESSPGIRLEDSPDESFAYLDDEQIKSKLILFEIDGTSRVQLNIPSIHCISCIWLLENLHKLNSDILKSEVNFAKKTVLIDFNIDKIPLSKVASLLASTGYKPAISLEEQPAKSANSKLIIQLAVAGFCFGNIMMLSFPEYFGIDHADYQLKSLFSFLNIALSIPVVFYSAQDYFMSAWKSFRQKQINIDVPIAVGIAVLFIRSGIDILNQTGPGYMDSLAGLVFFLLIGRWFQNKTYESLAFDRDYKSYFPLAVSKLDDHDWSACLVHNLKKGDHIRIRNNEIVPADSLLSSHSGHFDYSFVTGESKSIKLKAGDLVYAGGKVIGQPAIMVVSKMASQSHLTSLWNNEVFAKSAQHNYKSLMDRVAKVFTWSVLFLALLTGLYWYWHDQASVWLTVSAVLMVACPCALALAAPFTYGNMLRVFGTHGLYLRNAEVVESMANVDAVVFDKTGTITYGSNNLTWHGSISDREFNWVKSLAASSTHPLSVLITKSIKGSIATLTHFEEHVGQGTVGKMGETVIRLGSAEFVGIKDAGPFKNTRVYVAVDGIVKGYFEIGTKLRIGIKDLVGRLGNKVKALLSGDNTSDKDSMSSVFHPETELVFMQSPQDKLNYISAMQKDGNEVLMLGDGLNDAGALKQSNVGIAVSDNTGLFTPSCDGILRGDQLKNLDLFLDLSKSAVSILKLSLVISLVYNLIGLGFAVTGHLTPLIAAILMPISSISVVAFTTFMVNLKARLVLS